MCRATTSISKVKEQIVELTSSVKALKHLIDNQSTQQAIHQLIVITERLETIRMMVDEMEAGNIERVTIKKFT